MTQTENLFVAQEEADQRLDKLLSLHFPEHSRTYFQYLIEQGCVLVNGKALKKRTKPQAGDEIEICFLLTPELSLEPEAIPLDILYEDDHLLVINKPVGMVVHPAPGNPRGTFANALLHHCKQLPGLSDSLRPGIVHRLDKDTSGVLMAAKTYEMHQALIECFSLRKIKKTYLAICLGKPQDGTIEASIGRHPVNRKEMCVSLEGKPAVTHLTLLAHKPPFSLVKLEPITGRTHQLRVHLDHLNCPILGDMVYGSFSTNRKHHINRQLLHAYQLNFTHPFNQKILSFTAPIPEDMAQWISMISQGIPLDL